LDGVFCCGDPLAIAAGSAITAAQTYIKDGCRHVSLSSIDRPTQTTGQCVAESVFNPDKSEQAPRARSITVYDRIHARDSIFQDKIVRGVQHRSKSEHE
jgi:DNA-binding LacI/PurR family transcriptional regulator